METYITLHYSVHSVNVCKKFSSNSSLKGITPDPVYVLLFIRLISIQNTSILYRKETMYRYKHCSDPYCVTAPTDYRTSNGPSTAAGLVLFI